MHLAHHRKRQTRTAALTLPSLSPLQAAIRAHRVTTARINNLDARGEDEESETRLAALEAEDRAWNALLAAPCADRADAATLLLYASLAIPCSPPVTLAGKLYEALAVTLREPAAAGGGGDGASPGDDGAGRVPVLMA